MACRVWPARPRNAANASAKRVGCLTPLLAASVVRGLPFHARPVSIVQRRRSRPNGREFYPSIRPKRREVLRQGSLGDAWRADKNRVSSSRIEIELGLLDAGRTARGTLITRAQETPLTAYKTVCTLFAALRPPTAIASTRRADPPARNPSAARFIQKTKVPRSATDAPRHSAELAAP